MKPQSKLITSLLIATMSLLALPSSAQATQRVDVLAYGAKGDGVTIDSPAIDRAISAAAAMGGGDVVIPAGRYSCYSIHLQSHVNLRLDKDAVIVAAAPTADAGYDAPEYNADSLYQDFGHSHWHNSLLWGENLQDVEITGEGLIDGTGVLSRGHRRANTNLQPLANKALAMRDCQQVTIRGVRFLNCGHFAMLLTGVDHLLIEDVVIDTNRDGIDIDCCEDVLVRRCQVNTLNDDAIVLKCSYALGWLKPTQNVVIEDCDVSGYDTGTYLDGTRQTTVTTVPDRDGPTGRIKLGTESNSAFCNIIVRRCTFTHCRGLAIETVDGATIEHVEFSDITMHDICNSPIYIRLGNRMRAPSGTPPSLIDGVRLSRITVTDADARYASLIYGMEGNPVRNVTLRDISIQYRGGLTLKDYEEQRGRNTFFASHGEATYPEPSAHGIQPSWGWSLQHVDGLIMDNVRLSLLNPDERPMTYMEDVINYEYK